MRLFRRFGGQIDVLEPNPPAAPPSVFAPPEASFVPADFLTWPRTNALSDWSVIDVETTGLYPSSDRIVEIGVVRLSPRGEEIASWTTLVDPDRDIGASHIHGLTAYELRGAPRFADIAPGLLCMLSGTRLAAHNARFDLTFVSRELERSGATWGKPDALCTMMTAGRLRLSHGRSLAACCEALGIENSDAHCAESDARAAARVLACALARMNDPSVLPALVPTFPESGLPPSRTRKDPPPPRMNSALGSLASRVGVPAGIGASDDVALIYFALLDEVLEDRRVTEAEVCALSAMAHELCLDVATVTSLHAAYLGGVWELAKADGIITDAERRDLTIVSELLGVAAPAAPVAASSFARREHFVGKSVCFTGASVVTIGGEQLSREDQEGLAEEAGMVVKSGVSRKLDILVLANPDSRSGKSKLADERGVRKIAEPVFWRALGVDID